MDKVELLGSLNNVLNNYVFGMVLCRSIPAGVWPDLEKKRIAFEGPDKELLHVELAPLAKNLANPEDRELLLEEYENTLKRATLSEGHELLLGYCETTNQFQMYKAQEWFQFARLVRNIVSHKNGGILRQWPKDLQNNGITNVAWRARSLGIELVGQPLKFTHKEAIELLKDQMDFASSLT